MMINRGEPRRGTQIIEMAIVGPVALLLVIGIMDIGLAVWSYNNISEAAREGGRYAQIHGAKYAAYNTSPPASGPIANDANVEKVVRSFANVNPTTLTVTSTWPNANNNPDSPVIVEVAYSYTPLLSLGLGTLKLHTATTFYINY